MAIVNDYLNTKLGRTLNVNDNEQIGIAGFNLDVRVRESTRMESSAPTKVLEDGSFANDHIIVNPVILQIDGEVSDIHLAPSVAQNIQRRVARRVGVVSRYLPAFTNSQLNRVQTIANDVLDVTRKIDDVIEDGESFFDLFGDKSESTAITQKFFDTMDKLRLAKALVKIQMPDKLYENMAITSLTINRDNQFEPLTYSLTAQEVRFAAIEFEAVDRYKANPSTSLGGQTDEPTNKGVNKGKEVDESLLSKTGIGDLFQ